MCADTKHNIMSKKRKFSTVSRRPLKKRRNGTAMSVAKKALAKVNAMEKKVEDKFITTGIASTAITDAGTVIELFAMAQGINFAQRIGIDIYCKWMVIRYHLVVNGNAAGTSFRLIIVQDKQQVNSTDPPIATILETLSPDTTINHVNRARFRVLYDSFMTVSTDGVPSIAHTQFIKLRFTQRYTSVDNTGIDKNGIYVVAIGNEATNDPVLAFFCAMHYNDM